MLSLLPPNFLRFLAIIYNHPLHLFSHLLQLFHRLLILPHFFYTVLPLLPDPDLAPAVMLGLNWVASELGHVQNCWDYKTTLVQRIVGPHLLKMPSIVATWVDQANCSWPP